MSVAFNTMFKNEERLLSVVLPIWSKYPIDLFIFYDDNSTDNSVDIINELLEPNRFIIINDKLPKFNEGYQRQRMIEVSREKNVDIVIAIDCDELLSSNIIKDFNSFLKIYNRNNMLLFWYNLVNNDISLYRNDPSYTNNYRSFVLPLNNTGNLNKDNFKYHTPRTPNVNLPAILTKEYGVLHLQALNTKFYAIKQLWYKHHEFVNYGHSVQFINSRYDGVVNNLNFNPEKINHILIDGINISPNLYDGLEIEKGYLQFIYDNYNEDLITFGKEYL
jgi:hypothetical protein